jgi:hypothetical protein
MVICVSEGRINMTANANKKSGCLTFFLSWFGQSQKATTTQEKAASTEILPYRLRDDFLSPAEFSFYRILVSLAQDYFTILTKVRLADLFFVARPNENISYFNRITPRHVDFVFCESNTMRPLLGIELDDSSHARNDRQHRDDFVDRVFESANLPLLHISVQRTYNTREIDAKIAPILRGRLNATEPPAGNGLAPKEEGRSTLAPSCPKCGIPIVIRTVVRGEHKRKQFYGCQNYPRRREVKPFCT